MKLNKIRFIKHIVLEGLDIDFCINGAPSSTILLAGENGTGKTSILNAIFNLSKLQPSSIGDGENIIFNISLSTTEAESISKHPNVKLPSDQVIDSNIEVEVLGEGRQDWNRIKIRGTVQGNRLNLPGHLFSDEKFKKTFRLMYSNVAINFAPRDIISVTAKNIDELEESQATSQNTATEITQLLIDIQALDDADLSKWVRDHRGIPVGDEILDKRISRFQEAFSLIFPTKKYKEIRNFNNQKKVVFTENEKECFIENLSSGEKQIVFRGGFFLKDTGTSQGSISIIDEPEISLHPKWQLKIIEFYKTILDINNADKHSQMIIATHSPFIMHNYDRSNDKVVILKKNADGNIEVSESPSFYGWKSEEAIKEAFSISPNEKFDSPLILVEGETDEKYISAAITELNFNLKGTEVKWVGRISENGNAEFTGDNALNHTISFARANPNAIKRPLVLLFDSDTKKQQADYENLAVRTMPLCEENETIKKGIENLLIIPEDIDMSQFVDERNKVDAYGITNTIRTLNKTRLCDHLIDNTKNGSYNGVFGNFTTLLESLEQTIQHLEKC